MFRICVGNACQLLDRSIIGELLNHERQVKFSGRFWLFSQFGFVLSVVNIAQECDHTQQRKVICVHFTERIDL